MMASRQVQESNVDELYNPYEHRLKRNSISDFSALSCFVKSIAGVGLFTMPYAFQNVGLILGIVGTIVIGLVITIFLRLLLKSHYIMCMRAKQPILNYHQVVAIRMTTGIMKGYISYETASLIVEIVMLISYMGIGAGYVVFIAGIIQECIDVDKAVGEAYYALILVPFFLLLNMVKGLHAIARLSIIGNLFLIISCLIGIVHTTKDSLNDDWILIQPDVILYPKFVSIVFFALCSPALLLTIEHNMKNPWNYTASCGVINLSMGFLICGHIIVGIIGYCKWGSGVLGNFILNHDADESILVALILQALAIYFTYCLQCYIPISILYEEYAIQSIKDGYLRGTPYMWDIIVRTSVTLITCMFAATIPRFLLFANFIGSLCMVILSFIFPISLYIINNYGNFGIYHWKLFTSLLISVIVFIIMLCSSISSVASIINYLWR